MATVFKGGNVVDGSGQRPMFVGDVVVEGTLITAVHDYADGEPAAYPAGATVIDCAGKEVTPGWIDQHTHYVRFPMPRALGLRLPTFQCWRLGRYCGWGMGKPPARRGAFQR